MRPLRVAIVAPTLAILGGQAIQADRLIRGWRNDPDVDAWLVPVNPVPPAPLRWARRLKYLRTAVTEATYLPLLVRQLARADLVHVFSASYTSFLLAPLPALIVAKALGRPVVLNYRSGEAPDHLKRSAVARRWLSQVDRNVVPSQFLVDVFGRFGISAMIVPNVVDPSRFRFRERDPLRPRLLSTRNLDYPYNVACTLRAFRLVQDRWPEASLTLVGSGADEVALKRLACELGLRNVNFTGRVTPELISAYYDAHDIYVQSPDIDNTPTSVIEAFASGLPVVSTGAGGVPRLVTDRRDGLLSPTGNDAALAANILRLLSEPQLGQQLARNAHLASRAYTWPAVRDQWLHIYRGVLATRIDRRSTTVTPANAESPASAEQ